ncbi:hypothetical protein SRHO_G00037420 [Serrasalmus rhombeus]
MKTKGFAEPSSSAQSSRAPESSPRFQKQRVKQAGLCCCWLGRLSVTASVRSSVGKRKARIILTSQVFFPPRGRSSFLRVWRRCGEAGSTDGLL